MANINDILSNLNSRHEEITDLVPDMRVFVDDFSYAKNEYGAVRDNAPLGSQLILLDNGKLLWVGIDGADDNKAKNVRRYNANGTLDTTFTCPDFPSGTNGFVRSVGVQSDGKLIVVGHFNEVGGVPYGRIVRLNTDGSVDATFNNGEGVVSDCLVADSSFGDAAGTYCPAGTYNGSNYYTSTNGWTIYFDNFGFVWVMTPDGLGNSGAQDIFHYTGDPGTAPLTGWDGDRTLTAAPASTVGFNANAFVVRVLSDDTILVGGQFTTYNGASTDRLVKLSSNGELDTSFSDNVTGVDDHVNDIFVSDNAIYIGGQFINGIAKLNIDGTSSSFTASFNGRVTSIKKDSNGKIVVGGWFTQLNSADCNPGIVRLNSDGSLDSTFATEGTGLNSPEGIVQTVHVQSDNKIIVGGWFNELNGERCGGIVRFNTNGTKDTSFDVGQGIGSDTLDWGARVQDIVSAEDTSFLLTGSFDSLDSRSVHSFVVLNSTGGVAGNLHLFKYSSVGIDDGGDDMYDEGNVLNTNLTQSWDNIAGGVADRSLSIPNTHTAASNENCFRQYDNGGESEDSTNLPVYQPWMDGQVVDGENYFGEGSSYFTNMYPGMFVMVATNVDINEFSVTGGLGSDGSTQNESSVIVTHQGATYTVFLKVNREGDGTGTESDPSINQLIIVPGDSSGITQLINEDGNDYDDHCIQGLSGRKSIAYLVVARDVSDYISNEDAESIALKFLEVIGGLSSTQTYVYDFSPQIVSPYGEGGLDTAIVVNEDGQRRSLQRTGYFEIVNADGGRKVVMVNDGETVTDEIETPEVNVNPAGHPFFT